MILAGFFLLLAMLLLYANTKTQTDWLLKKTTYWGFFAAIIVAIALSVQSGGHLYI